MNIVKSLQDRCEIDLKQTIQLRIVSIAVMGKRQLRNIRIACSACVKHENINEMQCICNFFPQNLDVDFINGDLVDPETFFKVEKCDIPLLNTNRIALYLVDENNNVITLDEPVIVGLQFEKIIS